MVRLLYKFQVYHHVRRFLKRLQVPLPHEAGFNATDNFYTNEEFFKICEDYNVPHDPLILMILWGMKHFIGLINEV